MWLGKTKKQMNLTVFHIDNTGKINWDYKYSTLFSVVYILRINISVIILVW